MRPHGCPGAHLARCRRRPGLRLAHGRAGRDRARASSVLVARDPDGRQLVPGRDDWPSSGLGPRRRVNGRRPRCPRRHMAWAVGRLARCLHRSGGAGRRLVSPDRAVPAQLPPRRDPRRDWLGARPAALPPRPSDDSLGRWRLLLHVHLREPIPHKGRRARPPRRARRTTRHRVGNGGRGLRGVGRCLAGDQTSLSSSPWPCWRRL